MKAVSKVSHTAIMDVKLLLTCGC